MSDYLNQTLWVAVFNVLAFIAAFALIYIVVSLLVNLLDHVVSFPVLRGFDWLVGGVLGLLRGSAVAVLVMAVLPSALSLVDPSLTAKFVDTSRLYGAIRQFDPLSVTQWINSLVG